MRNEMREQIQTLLKKVSGRMMELNSDGIREKYPVSLIDMKCWEWPQGIGLYGLYRYCEKTGEKEVLDYLINWYDERISEGIHEKNVNTTSPMLTLTYLYEKTGNQKYLSLIKEWTEWIMDENGLIRTGDGCFQHMITGDPNQGEILIDTLFMAVLFLARAGRILNREDCLKEADYQFLKHIQYLYNRKTGLFFHGWNFDGMHNYGEVQWGRGNSWYTIGIMEYLEERKENDSLCRYFIGIYQNQVRALKKYQDKESGLWHSVINNPRTYIEASASAAFLAGIMKGIRLDVLGKAEFERLIAAGVPGLIRCIAPDGTVEHVSYGTPIGEDEEFYNSIPCCAMTYGQALTILMLSELLEDYWSDAYETTDFLRTV